MHPKSKIASESTSGGFDPRTEALAMEILHEHWERFHSIARQNCSVEEDANDALQDAFLTFLSKFPYDDVDEPIAWFVTVLKRECWHRTKRHHFEHRLPAEVHLAGGASVDRLEAVPDHRHGPERHAEIDEATTSLGRLLAELKPNERRALLLKALGYSYEEIRDITGWSLTKVNRLMVEGRARLRELLADE